MQKSDFVFLLRPNTCKKQIALVFYRETQYFFKILLKYVLDTNVLDTKYV